MLVNPVQPLRLHRGYSNKIPGISTSRLRVQPMTVVSLENDQKLKMLQLFFCILFVIPTCLWAQQDSLMIYYKAGITAYEEGTYSEFYQSFKRANEI